MMSSLLPVRLFCHLLISSCLLLQACASTENNVPSIKIGMHIDAVLEFVMEYPLSWSKDRRLAYGSSEGEVRWTHPDHPTMLLRVKSSLQPQPAVGMEQQMHEVLRSYKDLDVLSREKVMLAPGEAWHVTGRTPQATLDLYLLSHAERNYLIVFTAAPADIDYQKAVMERVTRSFQIFSDPS